MMAAVTSKSRGSYDLESGTTSGEIPIENSDTENTLSNYKRQNRLQNIILVILCVAIVSLLCCLIEVVIRQLNKNKYLQSIIKDGEELMDTLKNTEMLLTQVEEDMGQTSLNDITPAKRLHKSKIHMFLSG